MEQIISSLAAAIVTILTFYSQRMVKGIDLKFDNLEMKLANLERSYKAETDMQKLKINELKSYNEKLMYQLINKNLRHAQMISEKVERVVLASDKQKKEHDEIYGKVIHLNRDNTLNKTSIAIQQKKLDLLFKRLKNE